jgi:XTP/dITP diphosphohydrolase
LKQTLLLATHNQNKVREMRRILRDMPVRVVGFEDYPGFKPPVESGRTLEQNAVKKACSALKQTGLWSIADDTGLFVDALQGRPGVRSARFAGIRCDPGENNRKLKRLMEHVPRRKRGATFKTVVALARPGRSVRLVQACVRGRIVRDERGGQGWGYDPLFEVGNRGKTYAEMSLTQKNSVSHRGRALRKMKTVLSRMFQGRPASP